MIVLVINYQENIVVTEMQYEPYRIQEHLNSISIFQKLNEIRLDQPDLKITLSSNNEIEKKMINLFHPEDTLDTVNKVCRAIYCADFRAEAALTEGLENGKYKNAEEFLHDAEIEKNKIKKKSRNR